VLLGETSLGETSLGETLLGETLLGETLLGEMSLGETLLGEMSLGKRTPYRLNLSVSTRTKKCIGDDKWIFYRIFAAVSSFFWFRLNVLQ
jgi:hypothetical protein